MAVEHTVGEAQPSQTTEDHSRAPVVPSPMAYVARQLPKRRLRIPGDEPPGSIQADYETRSVQRDLSVQTVGFTAEVRANSPAWLTGTIEIDE